MMNSTAGVARGASVPMFSPPVYATVSFQRQLAHLEGGR